jgi:hypothetical protein
MKIPESIIEKYKLTPSGEQTGQSFMQNQLVYKSGLPGFDSVVFMECDLNGMPSNYIHFYNKASKRGGSFTHEYLNAMKIVDILKFVV